MQFIMEGVSSSNLPDPGSSLRDEGDCCLYGDAVGAQETRCVDIGSNPITTGPSNRGWYLRMRQGSPRFVSVSIDQMSDRAYVLLAIPYPSGTTFTVEIFQYGNRAVTCSNAASAAAVLASNGRSYHFDGSYLFVKLTNYDTARSRGAFTRDGASLVDYTWNLQYRITANGCTSVATQGATSFCSHGNGATIPTTPAK